MSIELADCVSNPSCTELRGAVAVSKGRHLMGPSLWLLHPALFLTFSQPWWQGLAQMSPLGLTAQQAFTLSALSSNESPC